MNLFNSIIMRTVSYLPKSFAKPFAKPYVAGETIEEALSNVKILNQKGFCATLDILGEHVKSKTFAKNITQQYCGLYQQINDHKLDCTISVKPTHIGLNISYAEALENITLISKKASELHNFLRIDMESSEYTEQTFGLLMDCKKITKNIGVAMQAYLLRSLNDIDKLANTEFNARICKGIYKENPSISYKTKMDINNNFMLMAKKMAKKGSFAGYATHDQELIDKLLDWIQTERIPSEQFEFQTLYGVPMEGRLENLIRNGYRVRIYVPFGPDWFDYSVRRLKENPNIVKYVLKNFFKR